MIKEFKSLISEWKNRIYINMNHEQDVDGNSDHPSIFSANECRINGIQTCLLWGLHLIYSFLFSFATLYVICLVLWLGLTNTGAFSHAGLHDKFNEIIPFLVMSGLFVLMVFIYIVPSAPIFNPIYWLHQIWKNKFAIFAVLIAFAQVLILLLLP